MKIISRLFLASALCASSSVRSQVPMSGSLTATQACPAYQSFRNQTNPGNITLEVGRSYRIIAQNGSNASHYRIVIDGATPSQRWVDVSCGQTTAGTPQGPQNGPQNGPQDGPQDGGDGGGRAASYVLALGWEPAFCSEHSDKTECSRETAGSFDSTHLSLHGLWPQPRGVAYCHVASPDKVADKNHQWDQLPEPELTEATRQRLSAVMPGFQSGLERHEWTEHGTCSGVAADVYFNRAAELTEEINASKVRELFNQNIGQVVSAADIRAAFDQDFGANAGDRVMVQCQGQGSNRLISQIVVSLQGDVTGSAPIGDLIGAAVSAQKGCPSGIVATPPR